jgi:LysM repeat protein
MKKILLGGFILILAVSPVRAQDAGTQQQIDKLSGQVQDLLAAQEQQGKRLAALEKEISDLTDKVNSPAASTGASADDLKALAEKVQEIDKKRQDDRELILKQLELLGNAGGGKAPHHPPKPVVDTTPAGADNPATPAVPQKGYDYTIAPGDTLSAIAKAYRAQGVKVTTAQIIAANPKLNPNALIAGKKIFIPDAAAK